MNPAEAVSVGVGDRLPAFAVTLGDGTVVSDQTLLGAPAMIVFFNTTCPDCRRELPVVEQFYRRHGQHCRVVAIAREQLRDDIAAYWAANSLTLPYSPQPDRAVFNLFATERIPRIYQVNSQGIITAAYDDTHLPTLDELEQAQ
ncbi:MAG: TlpA family protein disulfide reductase [Muribaculaceae bacterium]|nr:TlpA family protein disulfide reductase [Muribaculaceae bacterium]